MLCSLTYSARGQYYYQDIYNTLQTNKAHARDIRTGVRKVNIASYDAYHRIDKDFICSKTIADDYRLVITRTASAGTGNSTVVSLFDDSARIRQTTDSTANSVNRTTYYYSPLRPEQLDSLLFTSATINRKDTFRYREAHLYQYNDAGVLQKMLRKKNGQPFSTVAFQTDSSGQVIKEKETGQQASPPPTYYKYNAEGRLTDVFHYNPGSRKMEPDFLFDYDGEGRLREKTIVIVNTRDYLLWIYTYDKKGLTATETCYGKNHSLQGSLEYEYSF